MPRGAADGLTNGMVRPAQISADTAAKALRQFTEYIPSKLRAESVARFAARQASIIEEITAVPDSPGLVAAQQKARGLELSRQAIDLARQLELAAQNVGADQSICQPLLEAASSARVAAKQIDEATQKSADGFSAEMERLSAVATLKSCAGKVSELVPVVPERLQIDSAALNAAENLYGATKAMRQALGRIESKPVRPAIVGDMRKAAEALRAAATARTEIFPLGK